MRLSHASTIATVLLLTVIPVLADTPPARAHHALVFDETRQQILLSGGSTPRDGGQRFEFFDDLWAFDGRTWQRIGDVGQSVSGHRLLFDPNQKRVVSVGGYDGDALSLHRELTGDRFKVIASDALPAAAEPGVTYERKRAQLLMFGGSGSSGASAETWIFHQGLWTRLEIDGPAARQVSMLLYLPSRGLSYLFGGLGAGRPPTTLSDFWQFDGNAWQQLTPKRLPSARHSSGYAYDSKRKRIILFGGLGSDGFLGDTWSFDGDAWTQLSDEGPSARAMGYLAYDTKRDRIVLFGGRQGWPDGDLGDTWEFDGEAWHQIDTSDRRGGGQTFNPKQPARFLDRLML